MMNNIDMELLIMFILLNIINVIVQTVKSICTIKCGKTGAAIVNAIAYGLYTIVTIYLLCDLPLMWKATVVALCNLVGVFIVKWIEEKTRKNKLWKVEVTVKDIVTKELHDRMVEVPHSYINVGKNTLFNFYCNTKEESEKVKEVVKEYGAKYFVAESKIL